MEHSALESDYYVPSKITVLVNNITKMSKNPSIECELSQVLDDFLQKLGECDSYLQNGIFNMNFAEAALLIQSSADVYSKKVDLLWDIIFDYQKRLLLSEEQSGDKNQELEKVEERKRKYKRKRKTNADQNETSKLVNNFSFGNTENIDYLNQNYETIELSKEWEKFQVKQHSSCDNVQGYISNRNVTFLPNNSVHNEDNDYIGRYDQFHSTSLTEEIFHLEFQKLLTDDNNCITRMRIDSYVINDFLLEKSIPSNIPIDQYSKELKDYVNNFFESHKHPEKNIPSCPAMEEQICRQSYVNLEKLPFNSLRDKRDSRADSLLDDDRMSTISEICPSPCPVEHDPNKDKTDGAFTQVVSNLENRSKSCSQDSAFFEDMEDHSEEIEGEGDLAVAGPSGESINAVTDLVENLPIADVAETEVASPTETPQIVEDVIETNVEATQDDKNNNGDSQKIKSSKKSDSPKTKQSSERSVTTRQNAVKNWSEILNIDCQNEDEPQEKRPKIVRKKRVSEKVLRKLATGVTANYRDFELFCRLQYKPAEGEGVVRLQLSDSEDSDEEENENHMSEDEENDEVSPVQSEAEEEEMSEAEENNEELEKSTHLPEESEIPQTDTDLPTIASMPDFNLPSCSTSEDRIVTSTPNRSEQAKNFSLSETDLEQDEICRKNVRDWRAFIVPKLRTLENRADFDIHEYGSEIIGPSEIGEQRYFKDIVKGKSSAEVARYFIATLQLANTYNVEITGTSPGEKNNSFQIKTLDKTKHHELLEDYQAPSEETFRERLERAKAASSVPRHSTPYDCPPVKKIKLAKYSRKKLF